MGDAGDNDGFDRRLAGQPSEPTANTQELQIAAHAGERTNADLMLGDVSVAEPRGTMEVATGGAGLLPWVISAVLALVLAVVVFGLLGSARDDVATLETELETLQDRVGEQRSRIEQLELEAAELREANEAVTAEAEAKAAELEALRRAGEQRAAIESRAQPPPAPKSTRKRKRSKRR